MGVLVTFNSQGHFCMTQYPPITVQPAPSFIGHNMAAVGSSLYMCEGGNFNGDELHREGLNLFKSLYKMLFICCTMFIHL